MTASSMPRDRPIARPFPCGAFHSLMCGIGANRPGGGSTCYEVGTVGLFLACPVSDSTVSLLREVCTVPTERAIQAIDKITIHPALDKPTWLSSG